MGNVRDIFKSLTNGEIHETISQMKSDEVEGMIRLNGNIRKYANQMIEITGEPITSALVMAQMNVLQEAAYRAHELGVFNETNK